MTKLTKDQLISRALIMIRKHREMLEINPDYDGIARDVELFEIALEALTADAFMHGIVDPEGIAHMDENCVALKPYALDEEVDALNDECPEPPFKVVPLYRLPLLDGLK